MKLLRAWLAGIPAYLWSGWGALASLFLLLAAWEAGSALYGALILPDPLSVFATLGDLLGSGAAWPDPSATPPRARPARARRLPPAPRLAWWGGGRSPTPPLLGAISRGLWGRGRSPSSTYL